MRVRLTTLAAICLAGAILLWVRPERGPHPQIANLPPVQALRAAVEVTVLAPPLPEGAATDRLPAPETAPEAPTEEPTPPTMPGPEARIVNVVPAVARLRGPDKPRSAPAVTPMTLYVAGDRVNLRSGPDTRHPVLTQFRRGAAVVLLQDAGGGWLEIEATDGVTRGFMAIDFLSPQPPR